MHLAWETLARIAVLPTALVQCVACIGKGVLAFAFPIAKFDSDYSGGLSFTAGFHCS